MVAQCNLKTVEEGNTAAHVAMYISVAVMLVFSMLAYKNARKLRVLWVILAVATAVFTVYPTVLASQVTSLGLSTVKQAIADGKCKDSS